MIINDTKRARISRNARTVESPPSDAPVDNSRAKGFFLVRTHVRTLFTRTFLSLNERFKIKKYKTYFRSRTIWRGQGRVFRTTRAPPGLGKFVLVDTYNERDAFCTRRLRREVPNIIFAWTIAFFRFRSSVHTVFCWPVRKELDARHGFHGNPIDSLTIEPSLSRQ